MGTGLVFRGELVRFLLCGGKEVPLRTSPSWAIERGGKGSEWWDSVLSLRGHTPSTIRYLIRYYLKDLLNKKE